MCENNAHFVFFIKRRVSFFKLCTFRFAVIIYSVLRMAHRRLAEKIRPKVYEHGFLK